MVGKDEFVGSTVIPAQPGYSVVQAFEPFTASDVVVSPIVAWRVDSFRLWRYDKKRLDEDITSYTTPITLEGSETNGAILRPDGKIELVAEAEFDTPEAWLAHEKEWAAKREANRAARAAREAAA